jgi:hypothetical protein
MVILDLICAHIAGVRKPCSRSYYCVLKLALSIADLAGAEKDLTNFKMRVF